MATRMQQRRATSAEWNAANPILADGEIGVEKDTGIVKIGNGSSTWNQLAPILGSAYLPVLGKAYDSDRLDGLDSSAFAKTADLATYAKTTDVASGYATKDQMAAAQSDIGLLGLVSPPNMAMAQIHATVTSGAAGANAWVKVALGGETHDSHGGHAIGSSGWTVPTGQGGTYLVDGILWVVGTAANVFVKSAVYVNDTRVQNIGQRGSFIHGGNGSIFGGSGGLPLGAHLITLSAGNTVTLWGNCSSTWQSYVDTSEEISSQLTLVRIR